MVWNSGAGEIVNEPTKLRVPLHPLHETDHVRLAQVMSEERAYDELNRLVRGVSEYVRSYPMDGACRRSGIRGDGYCIRIDVETGQLYVDAAARVPIAQYAVIRHRSRSLVENVNRLRDGRPNKCAEPIELRAIAQGPTVDQGEVAHAGAQLVAAEGSSMSSVSCARWRKSGALDGMEEHSLRSQTWAKRHGASLLPRPRAQHDLLQDEHHGSRGHIAVVQQNTARV